jgi:hypothetical protein
MALPFTFATLPAGLTPAADLDTNFAAVASLGVIPCTATGTNSLTLTPIANTPNVQAYVGFQLFGFVAPATSTGAVTIAVSALSATNVYLPNGVTQANVVAGVYYIVQFNTALNSGAGGFQMIGGGDSTLSIVTISATGSTQATAAQITTDKAVVTAQVTGGTGVALPAATAGMTVLVNNKLSVNVNVYPVNGGTAEIDSLGNNAAFSLPANRAVAFAATSATQWWSEINPALYS